MEAATLLLEATSCEGRPQKPESPDEVARFGNELADAKSCRMALEQKGIDDKHRRWLARLLTTRRIVIIPTANALGYFQNTREEDGVDPNRYGARYLISEGKKNESLTLAHFRPPEISQLMFKTSNYACRP